MDRRKIEQIDHNIRSNVMELHKEILSHIPPAKRGRIATETNHILSLLENMTGKAISLVRTETS